MKRYALAAVALLGVLLLSGCSLMNIEAQAYAVSLGVDEADDGSIRVSVQTPSLNSSGGSESGGDSEGGKSYTLSSAEGKTLSEALNMLQASIPREMNLSGVKSIVVSERLAQSDRFREALHELTMAYRVYGASELVVCRGKAEAFIENQQPVIGLRLSESIAVELAHCRENGYIPSAKTADVYYLTESIYGDPMAVLAAANEGEGGGGGKTEEREKQESQEENQENQGKDQAKAGRNGDVYAGEMPRSGDNKNVYFGAALFKNGVMVGQLTGTQTQLINMLLGDLNDFGWICNDQPVNLNLACRPRVQVHLEGEQPVIEASLRVNALASEKGIDAEALRRDLLGRLDELTAYCQACGVDPFCYAERAAAQFLTMQEWLRYDWDTRFAQAQVRYDVQVRVSEL